MLHGHQTLDSGKLRFDIGAQGDDVGSELLAKKKMAPMRFRVRPRQTAHCSTGEISPRSGGIDGSSLRVAYGDRGARSQIYVGISAEGKRVASNAAASVVRRLDASTPSTAASIPAPTGPAPSVPNTIRQRVGTRLKLGTAVVPTAARPTLTKRCMRRTSN